MFFCQFFCLFSDFPDSNYYSFYQDIEKIPALVEKKDFETAFYIINSCKSKANQMQADKEIQVLIKKSRELVENAKNNPSGIGLY